MSDDVQAMLANFSQAFSSAPATFYEYETGLTVPAAQQAPDSSYAAALTKLGSGIGEVGRTIGAARAAQAEAALAKKTAQIAAGQERLRGRRVASTARAVAGAQGSAEGLPLLSELAILQAAEQDAKTQLYAGEVGAYNARTKARNAYMKAPGDLLSALLEANEALKKPPAPTRPGSSLLTGR